MGNCLVTKLKESVNNPNLPYFDSISWIVNYGEGANANDYQIRLRPVTGKTVEVYVFDSGCFCDSSLTPLSGSPQTATVSEDTTLYFSKPSEGSSYKLVITNKSNLDYIRFNTSSGSGSHPFSQLNPKEFLIPSLIYINCARTNNSYWLNSGLNILDFALLNPVNMISLSLANMRLDGDEVTLNEVGLKMFQAGRTSESVRIDTPYGSAIKINTNGGETIERGGSYTYFIEFATNSYKIYANSISAGNLLYDSSIE